MKLRTDLRQGVRIGRAEFVRSVREYVQDNRRIIGFLIALLFIGGNLLFTLPTVFLLGRATQSVSEIPFLGFAMSAFPVALVLFAVLRTVERISGIEGEELLLTSVHPRAIVVGLLIAEVARLSLWFGVPLVLVAAVFAAGLGAPSFLLSAALVVAPLACCAAVWGYALGLGLLRALRRVPTARRLLKGASILLLIVIVVGSQFAGQYFAIIDVSLQSLAERLTFTPLVEYVSLAFVGTPLSRPTTLSSVFVFLGVLTLTPVGMAVAERQATSLWFTDAPTRQRRPQQPSAESSTPSTESQSTASPTHFTPPRPFDRTTTGRVAWGILVRAVRKPQELVHLLTIAFFIGPFVGTATQIGANGDAVSLLAAGFGVVLGAYLSGATFGLNALGDDRPQFPLLLLTETSPRAYIDGRLAAGLTVGLPAGTLIPLVALVASGSPVTGIAFALAGVGACVAAGLLALGLGCLYPIYDARELWGTETVAPSMLVMMVYTFVVLGGTSIGLAALWFVLHANLLFSAIAVAGIGFYLLLTIGVPLLSYRYAVRRYRRFRFD